MDRPKTIWKFAVPFTGKMFVEMPKGAQILTVQMQRGQPFIWAAVDPEKSRVVRKLRWLNTGHYEEGEAGLYVGTCQTAHYLVHHLFDAGEQSQ